MTKVSEAHREVGQYKIESLYLHYHTKGVDAPDVVELPAGYEPIQLKPYTKHHYSLHQTRTMLSAGHYLLGSSAECWEKVQNLL